MLKKKKENTYFRFGLKPQQGHIVATYVVPRSEFKHLLLSEFYGDTGIDRTIDQFDLIATISDQTQILLDNRLGAENVYGGYTNENTQIRILETDPDKASYGGMGFLSFINKDKKIVYRCPDGQSNTSSQVTKNEVIETIIYDPPIVDPGGLTGTFTQRITRDVWTTTQENQSFNILDKIFSLTGESENNPVIIKNISQTESTTKQQFYYDFYREDGEIITKQYGFGGGDIVQKNGGLIDFALSPMHSVFIANHSWEYSDQTGWGKTTKSFNIIDKDGDTSVTVVDGERPTKIFSTRPDNGEGEIYWSNWSFNDEAWPTVLKSNNKEDFLMLPSTGNAFILKDETKYILEPGSFDINGTQYNIGSFYPQFFATENMLQKRWKWIPDVGWREYSFNGVWGYGAWRERCYTTFSWFDDFIYKVRVDQLIKEPFYSQQCEDIVRLIYPNNPQPEIDYMLGIKAEVELLGLKGGSFFLDVINNITTEPQMEKISRFIGLIAGINNLLNIYRADASTLWVEKYQIEYSEKQANIVFKERFLNPFFTPLDTDVKACGDWDTDILNTFIPSLKSICYIPFN